MPTTHSPNPPIASLQRSALPRAEIHRTHTHPTPLFKTLQGPHTALRMTILNTAKRTQPAPAPQPCFTPIAPATQPYLGPLRLRPSSGILTRALCQASSAPRPRRSHQEAFPDTRPQLGLTSLQMLLAVPSLAFTTFFSLLVMRILNTRKGRARRPPRPVLIQSHPRCPFFIELWSKSQLLYHLIGKFFYFHSFSWWG